MTALENTVRILTSQNIKNATIASIRLQDKTHDVTITANGVSTVHFCFAAPPNKSHHWMPHWGVIAKNTFSIENHQDGGRTKAAALLLHLVSRNDGTCKVLATWGSFAQCQRALQAAFGYSQIFTSPETNVQSATSLQELARTFTTAVEGKQFNLGMYTQPHAHAPPPSVALSCVRFVRILANTLGVSTQLDRSKICSIYAKYLKNNAPSTYHQCWLIRNVTATPPGRRYPVAVGTGVHVSAQTFRQTENGVWGWCVLM